MKIEVLNHKPLLVADDNSNYLDLSYNSLNINNITSFKTFEVVTANTEMRVDKIAEKYYSDTKHLDILCKANNIFNPFAIEDGDILMIPNLPNDEKIYKNKGKIIEKDLRQNYIDTARLSTKDQNRIERLKEKGKSKPNGSSTPLPPNILKEGETNKTYKDGGIILGKQNK